MLLFYKFKLEYSSNISRLAFNNLLSNMERSIKRSKLNELQGSAEGWFLESRVNDIFKNNFFFGFEKDQFEVRYLFSFVEKTGNSEKTIYQHRKDSKNLMNYLIGKNNYDIIIDDIDLNYNTNKIKLNKKYYYLQQISQTGRSFDMAFLKKDDSKEVYNLYLFQCKINVEELKSKSFYNFEGENTKKYLNDIYDINIDIIYFTIIISDYNKKEEIINKIISNNLNYITFNYDNNSFFDKDDILVKSLDLKNSILEKKLKNSFYEEIISKNYFYDLFVKSSEIYLKNKQLSFYKIFIKKLINKISNSYKEQKELILSSNLKKAIINNLKLDYDTKFIFFRNCLPENLIDMNLNYNSIIFFKFNSQWYFYYKNYYKFTNSLSILLTGKEEEENIINYINKVQNPIIELEEVEKKMKEKSRYNRLIKENKSKLNAFLNNNIKVTIDELNKFKNSPDLYAFLIIESKLIYNILLTIFN